MNDADKINLLIDDAVQLAIKGERLSTEFTFNQKGRHILFTRIMKEWLEPVATIEESRTRDKRIALILSTYIRGFQEGMDAERQKQWEAIR